MEQTLGTAARPLRVAIIGAGPAAFYAVDSLFKQPNLVCQVDMFNRFPTPYGLVREGVAPDHESIKTVTRIYDKTATNQAFRYFGNVTFGKDVHLDELITLYDQIVYAVGAQSDRRMGIPGEDFSGSFPATIFVGWYNGHPDYRDLTFDLSCEKVAVVGNGNVAMDVARILVTEPEALASTDIADHALEALRQSKVKEVYLLGRRGPVQASFTNPELKEFGELENTDVVIDPRDLELDAASEEALLTDKNGTRNVNTLRRYLENTEYTRPRQVFFKFLTSPVEVVGEDGKVTGLKVERNKLEVQNDGTLRAMGTGETEVLDVGLIFRSVGYRGMALNGVEFDEKTGTIPNVAGQVINLATGEPQTGQYVVGWAKRGPSGIIGTNKPDSLSTVLTMMGDLPELEGITDDRRDPALIEKLLQEKGLNYVTFQDWLVLNNHEVALGQPQGRPRVKVTRVDEMLDIIKQGASQA